MKTKKEFFKENWIVSTILSLLYIVLVFVVFEELLLQITSTFTVLLVIIINFLNDWYRDERINKLEEELKKIK